MSAVMPFNSKTRAFAINSNHQPSGGLMHDNTNNGNPLALTSKGVGQARSLMVRRMFRSQFAWDRRPTKRKAISNVIYEPIDHLGSGTSNDRTVDAYTVVGNKLPITWGRSHPSSVHQPHHDQTRSKRLIEHRQPPIDSDTNTGGDGNLFWDRMEKATTRTIARKESESSTISVSTSRFSHLTRPKRNIASLDHVYQEFRLQVHSSHGYVRLSEDKQSFNAQPVDEGPHGVSLASIDGPSIFVLVNSKFNATGMYSVNDKLFVCFDPKTRQAIPMACFDPCLCDIEHIQANHRHEFVSPWNHTWKLGFDKNGITNSFKPKPSSRLRRYHFVISNVTKTEFTHSDSEVANERVCPRHNVTEWERLGEKIFKNEIKHDPIERCILFGYGNIVSGSLNSTKKRSLKAATDQKQPVEHSSFILINNNKKKKNETPPLAISFQTDQIKLPTMTLTNRKRTRTSNRHRCINHTRRNSKRQVRHRNTKARNALCK
ncbi:hypothetical protein RDWZM_000611 [Blomia tropicalis]|uniref:Uncharacterized protein n=1 Tax=Blomia tropicalis TaxID=40697 RepID=A0A9Q0RPT8_BLOTA|nr:hypothetical protein RDWZM_000611 [Blomia tropicalis]